MDKIAWGSHIAGLLPTCFSFDMDREVVRESGSDLVKAVTIEVNE